MRKFHIQEHHLCRIQQYGSHQSKALLNYNPANFFDAIFVQEIIQLLESQC